MAALEIRRPVRLGLLGAGGVVTRRHLPALRLLGDRFQVVAVARGDPGRLAEAQAATGAARAYPDWRLLLGDPEVDAVLIASPNAWHHPQTLAALAAGKDVLCEKPPALNHRQAQEMDEAARRHGRILQYGFLIRFAEDTQLARQAVAEGLAGEVYHIRAWWLRRRGYPTKGSWFTQHALSGGGPLMDIGCHLLDRALHVLGYPRILTASAITHARLRESRIALGLNTGPKSGQTGVCDVEDLAVCLFRLAGGASLVLETSFALNRPEAPLGTEFLGDRGGLRIAQGERPIFYGESEGQLVERPLGQGQPPTTAEGLYLAQWRHFAECVADRREPSANSREGALLMQALEAAYRSAEQGREVRLDE